MQPPRSFSSSWARLYPCLAVLALATMVRAGDLPEAPESKESKDIKRLVEENGIFVETAQPGIKLSGYVEASYTYEFAGTTHTPKDSALGLSGGGRVFRENGDATPTPSTEAAGGTFDTDANDFNINAFKLVLEKELSDKTDQWTAGFRVDLMFGEDAKIKGPTDPATSAATIATADLYFEQAFVHFRIPIGNGLEFKVGKTVGLLGYEGDERPSNMNFSHSYLWALSWNGNDTGVTATYNFSDHVQTTLAIVDGWDASDSGYGGIEGFGKGITGNLLLSNKEKNAQLSTAFWFGSDGGSQIATLTFAENKPLVVFDMWGEWKPKCLDNKLTLAFNANLGFGNTELDAAFNGILTNYGGDTWWGIDLYAKYQFTKVISLAVRSEYVHDADGQRFFPGAIPGANSTVSLGRPVDLWDWTITAGFDIYANMQLRAEYRYTIGQDGFVNGGDQHFLAIDTSYSF